MKTRFQKVISILAVVFLIASFFAVNVSAASYYTATFNYPFGIEGETNWTESAGLTSTETYLNTGPYWNFYNPSATSSQDTYTTFSWAWPSGFNNSGYISVILGRSKFGLTSYSNSDTVWCDPFSFVLRLSGTGSTVYKYRICLRKFTDDTTITSALGYSDWVSVSTSSGQNTISVPQTKINIVDGGEYFGVGVFLDFYCSSGVSSITLGLNNSAMTVNYGAGTSPDYPFYSNASNGNIGGYEDAESALMDSAGEGLSQGLNAMSGFGNKYADLGLGVFTARLTSIMNNIVTISGLNGLLWVSISLGLFASLFGLAGAMVSASDRRASREAAAAARKAQNERLARAIERSKK